MNLVDIPLQIKEAGQPTDKLGRRVKAGDVKGRGKVRLVLRPKKSRRDGIHGAARNFDDERTL